MQFFVDTLNKKGLVGHSYILMIVIESAYKSIDS